MKIKPLNDWVLLEAGDSEEKTAGGIIIPESAKKKPEWGHVIAAGPGAYKSEKEKGKEKEKKFVPTEVKAGDRVLYERYAAREFEIDGQKITMVRESDILGSFTSEQSGGALQKKGANALEKKATGAIEKSKKGSPRGKAKK